MEYTAEERAIIWLCLQQQWDERVRAALLREARDPVRLMTDFEKIFAAVIGTPQNGVYKVDRVGREWQVDAHLAMLEKKGYFAVTVVSRDYPAALQHAYRPPLVLYGCGNRALLSMRKFCVVGSRIIPAWAEKTGRAIAQALTQSFCVITGFAEGGDSAAIAGALPTGKLICVLPHGLNGCYPASHYHLKGEIARKGLLLSEYLPEERVQKYSFHARNRLLAGLSEGVLVLSAGARSGTLITANSALDCGREVFALPHNVGAAQGVGCNALIKKGAYLCTKVEDIFEAFGIQRVEQRLPALTAEEARLYACLQESGEVHAAVLAERVKMPLFEVQAHLSSLELKGLAAKSGGNRYAPLAK